MLRLDPQNQYAIANLEKLYEEQHQWADAYAARQKLASLSAVPTRLPRHNEILAFLENELGQAALKRKDYAEATRRFEAAADLDARNAPAHLSLGDVRRDQGATAQAAAAWERMIEASPERAYLAFSRLESAYPTMGAPERFPELCLRLIAANPQDWRARLALARHLSAHDRAGGGVGDCSSKRSSQPACARAAPDDLADALDAQPPPPLVDRYIELTRDAIFYLDPHVCVRCRYRSTELLWQCPQCHEWNTFVEERIAPAKDTRSRR